MTTEVMNKSFRSKVVVVATSTKSVDFDYTGTEQVFTVPADGKYKIETWGAQGGNGYDDFTTCEFGGYSSGLIRLEKNQKLYIYIGEHPNFISNKCYTNNPNNSFNGSIEGSCSGGGGATDIRLASTSNWYDFAGLSSRIMIAGGGGGSFYRGNGGTGGGLIGGSGIGFNFGLKYT